MLLATQIFILLGIIIEIGMFFALLWYGRPPSTEFELIFQFFIVAALWVVIIDVGVVLFWWVSKQGQWPFEANPDQVKTNLAPEE
jgi:hypothetical protein